MTVPWAHASTRAHVTCYLELVQRAGWRGTQAQGVWLQGRGVRVPRAGQAHEKYSERGVRPASGGQGERQTAKANSHSGVSTCLLSTRVGAGRAVCRSRRKGPLLPLPASRVLSQAPPAFKPGGPPPARCEQTVPRAASMKTASRTLSRDPLGPRTQPAWKCSFHLSSSLLAAGSVRLKDS